MLDRNEAGQVMSGVTYEVTEVDGRPSTGLIDLAELTTAEVVAVVLSGHGQLLTVRGPARLDGDGVVLYEKDAGGVGKDVRTWAIHASGGRVEATERAIF